ncbi:MAG: FKBP-type peptidyl-prolyl cis-trans isomerase [Bacteroidota bacterium]
MIKKIQIILCVLISSLFVVSCKTSKKSCTSNIALNTFGDTISYIIGSDVGGNLKKNSIQINSDIFVVGLNKALKGTDSLFSLEKRQEIMTRFQKDITAKQQAKQASEGQKNKEVGQAFLEENKTKKGVVTLPSGLQYKIIIQGTGSKPIPNDEVTVNYEGRFIDGKIFDSSYERKEPATFPLSGVIKGWTEGLQLMNTGSTYELYIPFDLAYGEKGFGQIPGSTTLIFKVELISIKEK